MTTGPAAVLALVCVAWAGSAAGDAPSQRAGGAPAAAPARKIPGLTAPDEFPRGCVDCHIQRPDQKTDSRLSTAMKRWTDRVEPALLAHAQASMPAGTKLKGRHPPVANAGKDIPASCLVCHGRVSKLAPPFATFLHTVHLTGAANQFVRAFQGECTHCHKLDAATGRWALPSGPEK